MSHINEHPDFKVTNTVNYCPRCERETTFNFGLRHNAEDMPPEYDVCEDCGFDFETDGIV